VSETDIAFTSKNSTFQKRIQQLNKSFGFAVKNFSSIDDLFNDEESLKTTKCIILDCSDEAGHSIAGNVQVARQVAGKSYILVVVGSRVSPEEARQISGSGASLVMLDNEFFSTSKLEFITSQIVRSAYIPIKTVDLIEDSEVSCPLYMLMPKNNKFLKISKPDQAIHKEFLAKYSEVGELYIHRSDIKSWIEYTRSFTADDEASALRRCRANFLKLNQAFVDLMLMVSDQSAANSFAQGKKLFEECESFAKDLLKSLSEVKDPWDVINASAIGDFGSLERSPAIAAYAALLSEKTHIGKSLEVMVGALLADVGFLLIGPGTSEKIRTNKVSTMHAEERAEYEKHPIFSLNQSLSRKLPLSESVKDMISKSHERADSKGFPNRIPAEKITDEAMLIRWAQELDLQTQLRMGEERKDPVEARKKYYDEALSGNHGYSMGFLLKMKPIAQA
jgi:HD-GYP domain-containing protein (c-di-GMP phosphodiesterase class II)